MKEIINILKEPEKSEITLEQLAELLNIDFDELCNLTLQDISDISVEIANKNTERINSILENRNIATTEVTELQTQHGITKEDLSQVFFDNLMVKE